MYDEIDLELLALVMGRDAEVVPVLDWSDLTDEEKGEFDYLVGDDQQWGRMFARYRGSTFDLGEFLRPAAELAAEGWDGYQSDTFFSATLLRFPPGNDDPEEVIMGLYLT